MRLVRSGRAAFSVMRGRDLLFIVSAVIIATLLACGLLVAQVDAARARSQSVAMAQAQRDQAIDARAAQSRRIDQLTEQIHGLQEQAEAQATVIGRQEQAIRDLSEQVQHGGQKPVVTSVAPRRNASRSPAAKSKPAATKPTTAPTTAPKPVAQPVIRPAPQPAATTTSPGLVCSILILIC